MFVTDDSIRDDQQFFQILEASLQGGASSIQLREKTVDTRSFYQRALTTKALCQQYQTPLIINDRIDLALAIDADGVHIGQKDMPYPIARKLLGKDKIIGLSVSNETQAIEAEQMGVDYIGISPIFSTATKTKDLDAPLGIVGLKQIRQLFTSTILCIGGIHQGNAAEIIQNGADGLAVVSAISKAPNPLLATQQLKAIICQAGTNN